VRLNRHISEPIKILGLAQDDLFIGGALVGVVGIMCNQIVWGLFLGLTSLWVVRKLKRNRPRGILVQLIYGHGLAASRDLPPSPRRKPRLSIHPERFDWSVRD